MSLQTGGAAGGGGRTEGSRNRSSQFTASDELNGTKEDEEGSENRSQLEGGKGSHYSTEGSRRGTQQDGCQMTKGEATARDIMGEI